MVVKLRSDTLIQKTPKVSFTHEGPGRVSCQTPLGQQTGWKWWGKVPEAGGPGLPSAGAPLLPTPHSSVPLMVLGSASRVPRKRTRAACEPTCFLVTETHQHFLSPTSKPGHYFCQLVSAEKATQENPGCVLGVMEVRIALMLNLTPALTELLRPQTREPCNVSLLSSCRSGLATTPQGWWAVVSPRSSLELVWAAAASVSRLCGCCFLKSKQRAACLRMEATSTPDSGTHGQAVKVPELPGRLRPRPAPLRPHVRVQTQPGHFLRAEQPQGHGFPTQNLSFFICRMEVMACPPCRGLGRVAMDMGQGRGTSCFLQFPAEALWA